MRPVPPSPFHKHLHCLKDPRRHNTRHLLQDILMIAICAIISGADSWTQVAEYGRSKLDWFKEFLELPHGIPSHDTFGRLFAKLDPQGFHDFFSRWLRELSQSLQGKTVAIDGKTLRGSHDRAQGRPALHLVSAWVSDLRLVLGQLKTADKSNEITAIPELIKTLALQGAVVTIDAMGCRKKITQTMIDAQADYVIQVKDNQKGLHEDIALFFQEPANGPFDTCETVDGEHGRIETRRYFTTDKIGWLPEKRQWPGINTICLAIREREVKGKSLLKPPISSPASKTRPPSSPKPSGNIGVSKTTCTGAWIYLSEKITAASAKTMARKIWPSCATWRPTCLNGKIPSKAACKPNVSKRHGTMAIC